MHFTRNQLDVTSVTDREDIVEAFGAAAMWRASIKVLTKRYDREADPRRKRHLALLISNAETQLSLCE